MKNSVAILWDAENVNPNQKEGLIEEKCDFVQIESQGLIHYVTITNKGKKYIA